MSTRHLNVFYLKRDLQSWRIQNSSVQRIVFTLRHHAVVMQARLDVILEELPEK